MNDGKKQHEQIHHRHILLSSSFPLAALNSNNKKQRI